MDKHRDNKGRFTKGAKGKPKGSSNKTSKQLRAVLSKLLQGYLADGLEDDLEKMEAKDRAFLMVRLAKFVLPECRNIELSAEVRPQAQQMPPSVIIMNPNTSN